MQIIRELITVHAPVDRCFDLSIRLDLVQRTLGMKLVDGPASGSISNGSRVHWRGWKFGLPSNHHTLITGFVPPHDERRESAPFHVAFFQDTQEQGRFASFHHDHFFSQSLDAHDSPLALLEDHVHFSLPWFFGGSLAERLLVGPYITRLVRRRFALLKQLAEHPGADSIPHLS